MNTPFRITGSLKIVKDDECFIDDKRIKLLELVAELGSINAASKKMKMSYQQAWHFIKKMNEISPLPLVVRQRGGANGGGAELTKYGEKVLFEFKKLIQVHKRFKEDLNNNLWLCNF